MNSRDRGVFLKHLSGKMIKGKYLFLLVLKAKTDTVHAEHGILQLKHSGDLFCSRLGLFVSFCQSKGGSDLGLQLFVRTWQHLAVLSGEVWWWGSRVHREE